MSCQKPELVSVERKGLEEKPALVEVVKICKHPWDK